MSTDTHPPEEFVKNEDVEVGMRVGPNAYVTEIIHDPEKVRPYTFMVNKTYPWNPIRGVWVKHDR